MFTSEVAAVKRLAEIELRLKELDREIVPDERAAAHERLIADLEEEAGNIEEWLDDQSYGGGRGDWGDEW